MDKIIIDVTDEYIGVDSLPSNVEDELIAFLHQYSIEAPLRGKLIIEYVKD